MASMLAAKPMPPAKARGGQSTRSRAAWGVLHAKGAMMPGGAGGLPQAPGWGQGHSSRRSKFLSRRRGGSERGVSDPAGRLWGKEETSPEEYIRNTAFMTSSMDEDTLTDLQRVSPSLAKLALGGLTERRQGNASIKSNPFTYTLGGNMDLDLDSPLNAEDNPPGTVLGAIALITGSTVGAGVLALPATVAPAGFFPSSAVLGGCWAFLAVEALLMAEVCVACMRERDELRSEHGRDHTPIMVTIPEMAARTLGDFGQNFSSSLYLFLSITLLTAYIAKSGEVLSIVTPINPSVAAVVFSMSIATVLCSGGTRAADLLNRGLTFALLVLFGCVVGAGSTLASWEALSYANWPGATSCMPIAILALTYHDLVPVVCSYLDGDAKKIRLSLVAGSLVPLAMFVLWDGVALAIAPQAGAVGGDPLSYLMSQVGGDTGSFLPGLVVSLFSVLALATSFIGTSLGMSAYAAKVLQDWTDKVAGAGDGKGGVLSGAWESLPFKARLWWDERGITMSSFYLVLVPPLAVAIYDPSIFLGAATFAGAYGNTVLYGVLPPMMAWQMRPRSGEDGPPRVGLAEGAGGEEGAPGAGLAGGFGYVNPEVERLVPGGTPVLVGTGLCSVAIAASRAAVDLGTGVSTAANVITDLDLGSGEEEAGVGEIARELLGTVGDSVGEYLGGVGDSVGEYLGGVGDSVVSVGEYVGGVAGSVGELLGDGPAVDGLGGAVDAVGEAAAAMPAGWLGAHGLAAGSALHAAGIDRVVDALHGIMY